MVPGGEASCMLAGPEIDLGRWSMLSGPDVDLLRRGLGARRRKRNSFRRCLSSAAAGCWWIARPFVVVCGPGLRSAA